MRITRLRGPSAVLLLAASLVAVGAAPAAADPAVVTVTVNARQGLATVPTTAYGVNDAVWDAKLGTTAVSDLLRNAGVQMIRYPGGSYADIYHWQDNTAPGGYVAPDTDFDTFMGSVRRIGAQPIIIANYGTGTPEEAAGWVRYSNVTKGYGAKYWEIGNEIYGNGHYGSNWEADNHADKSPAAYAAGVVAYADAMKAVDPTVKIGAVLTTPANWPDAIVGDGDAANWNRTVLSLAGSKIDFVTVHWYPPHTDAADVLTKTAQLPDMMYLLRQQINRYAGAGAATIGIALTETNTMVGMNTQPGALYAADAYTGLLENGVFNVDWWNVHNGLGEITTVAGQTDYGDMGLLSSANCSAAGCEPALNTPFAPYHAIALLSTFARAGDQLIRAGTSDPLVAAHAARRPNGDLSVLLINKDPSAARTVAINYAGYSPSGAAPTVYSLTNGAAAVSTGSAGSPTGQTLPPYSITAIVVHPAGQSAGTGAPGAPGQPSATAVTDRSATISWPAATAGSHGIVKYEVYRQFGTTSEQLGETPGTSFTVGNLNPGTRYTVNVVTRDSAGAVSWSSPPLTITTGTPTASGCTVRYSDTSDWGSGYVGSVDITNTGTQPINGWELRFGWPTPYQSFGGGWNGNWTPEGTGLRVTNLDWNGSLAANGGTANVGLVGNYNGPNILPTLFRLNGVLCTAL